MSMPLGRLLLLAGCLAVSGCASFADTALNSVYDKPPYVATPEATALHDRLTVVDLHADPLMWDRDLLERSSRGHVDVPRLLQGNVSVQTFGVVTGVPFPPRLEKNEDERDVLNLIAWSQAWPEDTHTSRFQRALFQAEKLQDFIGASDGKLTWIRNREELQSLLDERSQGKQVVGALLALEGTHALEGSVENVEELYRVGYRMMGLVHYTDNAMAASTHGTSESGLTDSGRQLIRRMMELGIIIDLSHSSLQTIDDVIAMVNKPVIASHGGVRGTCDTARNLEDRHVRAIADTGGVIGVGIYRYATCGRTLDDTVRAMRYVADLVGVDHVALGSDFDGSVATVFDSSGWAKLTEALLNGGFSSDEVEKIMGGNAIRVFREVLPAD